MRAITVLVLAAAAVRLSAQSPASPVAPAAAFESFLRVVTLTGQPLEAVSRVWPLTLDSRSTNSRLSLSAAHSVELILGADPQRRDDVVRLQRARWSERVADIWRWQAGLRTPQSGRENCSKARQVF